MSRASKREGEQFSQESVDALRKCALGKWGMFGQNDSVIELQQSPLREMFRSDAEGLIELGAEIGRLRNRLGYAESFRVFDRYMEYRQMRDANSPGEPKWAARFLKELEEK